MCIILRYVYAWAAEKVNACSDRKMPQQSVLPSLFSMRLWTSLMLTNESFCDVHISVNIEQLEHMEVRGAGEHVSVSEYPRS